MLKTFSKFAKLHPRWQLAIRTIPLVMVIIALKSVTHYYGYEILTPTSLFTAIISANIFLISFLLSGVLSDYKESEKIPGDLATSLENLADEGFIIYNNKKTIESKEYLEHILNVHKHILDWFYEKKKTSYVMKEIFKFNDFFYKFESQTQPNFIVRLKQEQTNLRRIITRSHTIRKTSFLGSGYAIAEIITFILSIAMIILNIEPFYESIFFVSFVSFILIYMVFFIKDLDNPFSYAEEGLTEEIPLQPIINSQKRIQKMYDSLVK